MACHLGAAEAFAGPGGSAFGMQDAGSSPLDTQKRLLVDQGSGASGLFGDAVPFTPSQGACGSGVAAAMSQTMFSPFSSPLQHARSGGGMDALGLVPSDGSSGSDASVAAGLATSPIGSNLAAGSAGYSPFMGTPWGNSLGLSPAADGPPTGPTPLELPNSPMSPGIVFNPTPTGGTPGSPRALFQGHSSAPFGLNAGLRTPSGSLQLPPAGFSNSAAAAAAAADVAAAQAAALGSPGLPQFYFNAAAAAAAAGAGAGSTSPLQAALNQQLMNQHTVASLAAQQHQHQQQQHQQHQQLLQASLSMALANQAAAASNPFMQNGYPANLLSALEPMRSAGGSLSLDGGLQQQASVNALLQQQQHHQQQLAAVMAAQQQHAAAASQLRRNMSTPAGAAAQLGFSSAAAAAQAQLGLGGAGLAGAGSGLPLGPMGRLHVTHSADLSHLEAAALLGGGGLGGPRGPKFSNNKARKNSEPKIGPDGQPRLNARQRRTLRRAKERALKGLLEVSQALLQKAEVQVTVPNINHLTALEELAAVEAEKEAANAASGDGGDGGCLSPGGTSRRASGAGTPGGAANGTRGVTRSQQLAAAAAAVEESVCEIARAAVAAVTAQANGKDTSSAAAAAKAAAAQAATAAASAGAMLPPGYGLQEADDDGPLAPCGSDALECLAHSAPTSPVGSNITVGNPSSGRSSSSSNSSLPGSARCSSSSTGSVASSCGNAGKPPLCQPPRPASTTAVQGAASSPLCSPLPSPTPSCGLVAGSSSSGGGTPPAAPSASAAAAAAATAPRGAASQLEGIDIAGLIGQLSLKKDEGMVDDKLIRDLQIIQSLIGALKAPGSAVPGGSADGSSSGGLCSATTSPVPPGRHLRGGGAPKALPRQRCNSPGLLAGAALHMA